MYTDTITLFNRYKSSSGDMWYPTVVHGVNLNMDKASIVAKYGNECSDKAMLGIHYTTVDGQMYVDGKTYLAPKEWQQLTEEKLKDAITFKGGTEFDFFMPGKYENAGPISDEDFEDGFYHYMNSTYDYVFAITTVGGPYKAIPHFEVLGA